MQRQNEDFMEKAMALKEERTERERFFCCDDAKPKEQVVVVQI